MPLQATSGAASYDAFGGGVAAVPQYIEDVFSTWLYTGNGSSQTITNGIDLAGKGGLVWFKSRTSGTFAHQLYDTSRGVGNVLSSNNTNAESNLGSTGLSAFNANGFDIGGNAGINQSTGSMASWTFRKQPKFFDVVTYTGNGTDSRNISHNLQTKPGFIIVKRTDSTGDWFCGARSGNSGSDYVYQLLKLNSTAASAGSNTGSTDTTFNVGAVSPAFEASTDTNINGATYVAYLFAHNAGGFGLTGTDNVISCGSFTTDGSGNATVDLGYEPQWVVIKNTSAAENWYQLDTMRGWDMADSDKYLSPNTSSAEGGTLFGNPTATGFYMQAPAVSNTYIYIAIRRGPMKVPTSGTSVFSPLALSNTTGTKNTTGFPIDLQINAERNGVHNTFVVDRLRGVITNDTDTASPYLKTNATSAEATDITALTRYWDNTGFMTASYQSGAGTAYWNFQRAPSFFDEVCYTGTGSATTFSHNLNAVPELIITKCRGDAFGWAVYSSTVGNTAALFLETTAIPDTNSAYWNNTTPTSSVFSVGSANRTNRTSLGMVAYLFATCAGVSKVGSYTGTGTTKQVDCGFTGGARFVLIKKTSGTGSWYVWDSARGIVSGNDPYLLLNSTAAEVTNTDYIDTYSAGFEISSTAPSEINENGGSFIFFAVA